MAEQPRAPGVLEREEERQPTGYPEAPPPPPTRTSSLAIASLATGIAAWIIIPVIGAITAVITGFLAQDEIRRGRGRVTGSALATAGLVLGWVQIGLFILGIILVAALARSVPTVTTALQRLG